MNKQRRKQIAAAIELIEQAQAILEEVTAEEQEAYDNLPEGIQASERGELMEEYIYTLGSFQDALDTGDLQEIIDG